MQIQDSKPFRKQVVQLPLAIQIQVTESLEAVAPRGDFYKNTPNLSPKLLSCIFENQSHLKDCPYISHHTRSASSHI